MKNRFFKAATLAAAGIASQALVMTPVHADDYPQIVKDNIAGGSAQKLEKCYGVNAVGKNDGSVRGN